MAQSEICSQLYFLVPPIISYLLFFPRIHITTIIKNLISLEDLQVGSLSIHLSQLKLFSHKISYQLNKKNLLKVRKFQNENMDSSHCPNYERKIWKILSWTLMAEFFKKFRSYFGQCNLLSIFSKNSQIHLWILTMIGIPKA